MLFFPLLKKKTVVEITDLDDEVSGKTLINQVLNDYFYIH